MKSSVCAKAYRENQGKVCFDQNVATSEHGPVEVKTLDEMQGLVTNFRTRRMGMGPVGEEDEEGEEGMGEGASK